MPRVQVYLPEALHAELKQRKLPASELLQKAVRAEISRQDALNSTDVYLADLRAEVGEPSEHERAEARALAKRILDHARENNAGSR